MGDEEKENEFTGQVSFEFEPSTAIKVASAEIAKGNSYFVVDMSSPSQQSKKFTNGTNENELRGPTSGKDMKQNTEDNPAGNDYKATQKSSVWEADAEQTSDLMVIETYVCTRTKQSGSNKKKQTCKKQEVSPETLNDGEGVTIQLGDMKRSTPKSGDKESFIGYVDPESNIGCSQDGIYEAKDNKNEDPENQKHFVRHQTQFVYVTATPDRIIWKRFFLNFVFYLMMTLNFYLLATVIFHIVVAVKGKKT